MLKAAIFLLSLVIVSLNGPANAQDASNGDLRLVDGITNSSGRVEVYFNGRWGLICDDGFDARDARVICKQLGFGDTKPRVWPDAPNTNGVFLLDDLGCNGNETLLGECRRSPWLDHNCDARQNAGVECDGQSYADDLRLIGGTERSGSLEVRYAGRWGNVCSRGWGQHTAEVACRTLGFEANAAQVTYGYRARNPSLFLTDVSCSGNETSLSKCSFHGPFSSDDHCEDGRRIGLHCLDISESSVREIGVRLNRGSDVSGRLEVSISGIWGTVCADGFNHKAAQVTCRMLNLPAQYAIAYRFNSITYLITNPATEIWLDDVQCDGTEETLLDCQHRNWTQHNCGHHEDVGVYCTDDPHARDHHRIRLAGSDSNDRGFVEVEYYGIWGTVCEGLAPANFKVVCRSLNLPYGRARPSSINNYEIGTGPAWLAHVRCTGKERSLFDCPHRLRGDDGYGMCTHYEGMTVICE